ncbi:unnamed protein product [Rhizoctonia solani]|nr:unnamed protein product [Rhizoctonia solani]
MAVKTSPIASICGDVVSFHIQGEDWEQYTEAPSRMDERGKNLKRTAREIYAWSHCNHQGVLPLLGFVCFQGQMALVTPWMGAGSLKQYIMKGLLLKPLRTCSQLAAAVEYLHVTGVVHGDIKPDNILMTDQGNAQIADFGNAVLTRPTSLDFTHTTSFNCTIRFTAPEVLREQSRIFTKESDIYALGMTMFNIMTGQPPFAEESVLSFMNAIINMAQPPQPDFGDSLRGHTAKDEMWNLLRRCLAYAPSERPNAKEVKAALTKLEQLNNMLGRELECRLC